MSRPFDEVRYKGLLEGLEAAEIRRSALNAELRYEAEFFRKRYLREDTELSRWHQLAVGEFAHVTDGPHGYHVVDEDSPIVMLTAKNARDWFSDREGADPIAEWVDVSNKRSSLEEGDVILSTRGTVGMCALVTNEVLPANIDQDVARISWHNKAQFLPEFVVAYLNSTFGQDHISRHASGMVQQGMSLQKVREIPLPALSLEMQAAIAKTVRAALASRREVLQKNEQAEQNLIRALHLENWQPPEPLTYTYRASEAITAGRLDADYFAPKYEAMFARMWAGGECVDLDSLLELNRRGKQPEYAESGLPVVNSKHVLKNEVRLNVGNAFAVTSDDHLKIKSGDVLINGTGVGTIGRAATYLHDEPALPDNHVTILRPRSGAIDPVYLSVYLNTIAGQWQVEKYLRGSSGQIELYPVDIAQFKICLAPESVQQEIRRLVVEAFSARSKAQVLLENAKRAVEMAIEDSEAASLAYLKQNGA